MVDVTGKKDAIAIKGVYQETLNQAYGRVTDKIKWLYGMNHKLKDNLSAVQKYKKDIVADEEERVRLYQSLNNLLVKETNFEKEMIKLSQKERKKSYITIKPKFKDSDVDNFKINAMQEYLEKYPEYASKSSFKNILEKITEIEKGIKETKKKYNYHISEVLRELAYWPRNLIEAEDLIKRFKDILNEGNEKLKNMRYLKSIFYKLASEKEKMKVNIDILSYQIEIKENTIKQLKEEVAKAKRQDLEEMSY